MSGRLSREEPARPPLHHAPRPTFIHTLNSGIVRLILRHLSSFLGPSQAPNLGKMACYMLDFAVYKPPEELKMNHKKGGENARRWEVIAGPWRDAGWGVVGGSHPQAPGQRCTGAAAPSRGIILPC